MGIEPVPASGLVGQRIPGGVNDSHDQTRYSLCPLRRTILRSERRERRHILHWPKQGHGLAELRFHVPRLNGSALFDDRAIALTIRSMSGYGDAPTTITTTRVATLIHGHDLRFADGVGRPYNEFGERNM